MNIFGISKEELATGLEALYQKVVTYVKTEVLDKLPQQYTALETKITSALEGKLTQYKKDNDATVDALKKQLADYERRLSPLEQSLQRTGIVSDAIKPKGEVTFADVAGLARQVSDTAYETIRNYFLLEMAKKGYAAEGPDFTILDKDSCLQIQFLETDAQQKPHAGWNSDREHKTMTYLENLPELIERTAQWGDKVKVLFSKEGIHNSQDYYLLSVKSTSKSDWAGKLRDDLPALLQAYMLGYSLKCLEEKKYEPAFNVQNKYKLKDNSALLSRMSEIMLSEPNLATQFVAYYSSN